MEKKDAAIDAEVNRRVENAKQVLERQTKEELQAKKNEMDRELHDQEVGLSVFTVATLGHTCDVATLLAGGSPASN